MPVLPIVTFDDDVLRKNASAIKKNSDELQQLIDDMFDTMYNAEGVGLAAPQIGRLDRVFVADTDVYAEKYEEEDEHGPVVMINPEIIFQSEQQVTMEEGCLSIPQVLGPVERSENIRVRFKDRDFENQEMAIDGHMARVIQHETDHLDGVLFVDYLSFFKRKLLSSKLKALDHGETDITYPVVPKKNQ